MNDESIIIVINGKGGVGKDYCISHFTSKVGEKNVENISSIDPIKKIASMYGYNDNNKTNQSRRFLSKLKEAFVEWNELPTTYTIKKVDEAINAENHKKFVFVHIREPEEIKKFVDTCRISLLMNDCRTNFRIVTLLITDGSENGANYRTFGNHSDDDVNNFKYDFKYINKRSRNIDEFYDFIINKIVESDIQKDDETSDSNLKVYVTDLDHNNK